MVPAVSYDNPSEVAHVRTVYKRYPNHDVEELLVNHHLVVNHEHKRAKNSHTTHPDITSDAIYINNVGLITEIWYEKQNQCLNETNDQPCKLNDLIVSNVTLASEIKRGNVLCDIFTIDFWNRKDVFLPCCISTDG